MSFSKPDDEVAELAFDRFCEQLALDVNVIDLSLLIVPDREFSILRQFEKTIQFLSGDLDGCECSRHVCLQKERESRFLHSP
jgi:hypothetical protein